MARASRRRAWSVVLVGAFLIAGTAHGNHIRYLDDDAPPGGDGTSWATALRFLQDALAAAAVPGGGIDEIRVAQGIYRPDRSSATPDGTGDRHATFQLVNGVQVWGGYAGLGTPNPHQRDPDLYPTILSGDLAGNDGPDFAFNGDNSYHVVTASGTDPTALLGSVTVTAGNADGEDDPVCFGGPNHGDPCSSNGQCGDGVNCVSPDSLGAGFFLITGRPTIFDCHIVENFAAFQGAGMLLKFGSHATIAACTFSGNRALDNGGGMYLGQSSPLVIECSFIGNSGARYAGASCNRDHSDAMFVNCDFIGNTAAEETFTGGGAIVNASSSPTFSGCVFTGNDSIAGNGGAMYNKLGFDPDLGPSMPVVENCTFEDNTAGSRGAAMYNIEGSLVVLTGCVVSGNIAGSDGGAIYSSGELMLTDCALSGGSAGSDGGAIYNNGGTVTLIDSTIDGHTAGGDGGAVYNIGDEARLDLIGCLIQGNAAVGGGYGGGGGAIFARSSTVTATSSTFDANSVSRHGGAIRLYSLYGLPAFLDATDCTFSDNVASQNGGAIYADEGVVELTGCTMTGNDADDGGVVYVVAPYSEDQSTALSVTDCTLSANTARHGGGLALFDGNAEGELIVHVVGSTFDGNEARRGGAVYIDSASPTLTNCALVGNTGVEAGGGLFNLAGNPVLVNCLLSGNETGFLGYGGGVYQDAGNTSLLNCTVYGNVGFWDGGGIFAVDSTTVITNCILWANFDGFPIEQTDQVAHVGSGIPVVSYSCVQGWTGDLPGPGITSDEPMFVDVEGPDGVPGTADDDLRLQPGSPCIDAGDTLSVPPDLLDLDGDADTQEPTPYDLDGNERLADDACIEDAGRTEDPAPTVDMGAYEFQGNSPSPLPGDIDGDCTVGIADFLMLLGSWGPCGSVCPADLDESGDVGIVDFLLFMFYWEE